MAAAHAVVSHPGGPRRLPDDEPLPAEDYRRLFGVHEAVDRAADLPAFRERLLRALEEWFGYSTISVLHGPTIGDALLGGRGIKSGYSQDFLDAYARRWITSDPFMTAEAHRLLAERGVVTLRDLRPERVPEQREFVERFLRPNGIHDKVGIVIDAGAEGTFYVGVVVRGTGAWGGGTSQAAGAWGGGTSQAARAWGTVGARDIAVMRALARQLAPLATVLLARDRAAAAACRGLGLTPREREVAGLVAQGLSNQQIARRMFIGVGTVKKHLTRALTKTGTTSRTHLAARWAEHA
ncbi:helix-turn-helix transcriptional regulator [Streptomyces radicis]|uniref:LuxR family transcriptional regulator n=1 Tax=Streptomyces radicis TaxID=1750517 RepID=A0A3A9X0N3_9ACTN|nr:helix-turn-helix transcriptional regulator [Streptomyces radicis]RKN12007.1 LuxR family transcriptional regulator [Streptomyces radicis]RKN25942.1 LuxR family transcriptional regulator [Streptomyces radicis]